METTRTDPAARAPSARVQSRVAGLVWFAAMVAAWTVFFALLVFDEPALHELHADVRDLPLVRSARRLPSNLRRTGLPARARAWSRSSPSV